MVTVTTVSFHLCGNEPNNLTQLNYVTSNRLLIKYFMLALSYYKHKHWPCWLLSSKQQMTVDSLYNQS